jgi:hypothetical protein
MVLAQVVGLLTMVETILYNLLAPVPTWAWIEVPFYPVLSYLVGKHMNSMKQQQISDGLPLLADAKQN